LVNVVTLAGLSSDGFAVVLKRELH